jgi:hypothetical protein
METVTSIELFTMTGVWRTLNIGANSWRLKVDTMTMVLKFVFPTGMEDTINTFYFRIKWILTGICYIAFFILIL